MRIFHLVPNLNFGGLQEVVRGLALCQRKQGHSVTIGCWTNAGNNPEAEAQLESRGVRVVYLRRSADGGISYGRRASFHGLRRCLGTKNAEILHVHNSFGYYLYGALAARAAGGTKVVNTVHATVMFDNPRYGVRGKAQFWAAATLTDTLVSVCAEVETVLRETFFLPRNKLAVIENGIDLDRFLVVPARCTRGEVVIGAVGRMSREKNHAVLIEAFAKARRNCRNIRLRILGGGPLESKLKELALSLGLADAVEFCGFSNDVPGFLSSLDLFALPSDSEGLPLSLLEAIASGLPVVATAVGGVPRIVQKTDSGWLSAPRNADSLSEAIEAAIACPDRLERSERARRLVAQQYSTERMARDYEQLYQKLCS